MPYVPGQNVEVPLSLFGGLDTELAPPDLPEGISPSNSDVAFVPGSVFTRPGLAKQLTSLGAVTVTYLKTVRALDGTQRNLYLDSKGNFWSENPDLAPGTTSLVATTVAGSYARSATIFGNEYIAISDGTEGTDFPLQWRGDSGSMFRIAQDGPAQEPLVADYIESNLALASLTANGGSITGCTSSINTQTFIAVVTATTSAAHGLSVGSAVVVAGSSRAQFNGSFTVTGVPSTTTFTYEVQIPTIFASAVGRVSNVTEIASTTPHNLLVGDVVSVAGGQDGVMDGSQTVVSVASTVQWSYNNTGANNSPAPAGLNFTPTQLSAGTGGSFYTDAVATLQAASAHVGPGDPITIQGAKAGDGSFPFDNNVGNNPATWTVLSVNAALTTITFSILGIGNLTATNNTVGANTGTLTVGGASSPGQYQCVVFWEDVCGGFTRPSPPVTFTSAGNAKFTVNPVVFPDASRIVRLWAAFTGSGGSAFFFVPVAVTVPNFAAGGQPLVITSTQLQPQTANVVNVSDNTLFDAEGIDVDGNDLFAQEIPGPCLGFMEYGSRAWMWGGYQRVQNMLGMGFDAGVNGVAPAGWSVETSGGAYTTSGTHYGGGWLITGDGGANDKGAIQQGCYQDAFGVPILTAGNSYRLRCWLSPSASAGGNVIGTLRNAAGTVLHTAKLPVPAVPGFYDIGTFAVATADVVAGLALRLTVNSAANGATVLLDDVMLLDEGATITGTQGPLRQLGIQGSYVDNPSAFDGSTGPLIPDGDPTPVQCCSALRGQIVAASLQGLYYTSSQPVEPAGWTIRTVTNAVGACGPFAMDAGSMGSGDSGEEWIVYASPTGLYLYYGAVPEKISQEIQPTWNAINNLAFGSVWVKVDAATRRILTGVPSGSATAPDTVLVMDHKELDTAELIARSGPIRISFTGRMIATDMARKWSPWTITANSAQHLYRGQGVTALCLASGNGATPGTGGTGNVYALSTAKLSDDDFGVIPASYTTYFAVNHEQEQQLGLGSGRKILRQVSVFVSGTGTMTLLPYVDALSNPWPSFGGIVLGSAPTQDIAIGFGANGERIAVQVSALPPQGSENAGFNLSKLVFLLQTDPVARTVGMFV